MTRFSDRVERDLSQIADQTSPSSTTAWESIRQRIDEPADESTMEVIMLTPNDNPNPRSRTRWLVAASVAVIALVGGLIVVGNRDTAENLPADRPVPSTPTDDPVAVDGEVDVESGGEQPTDAAPVVVADPDLEPTVDATPAPTILSTETLPPVPLQASGQYTSICAFGNFSDDSDVSTTATQTCSTDGNPLPVQAQERNQLTLFFNASPTGGDGPDSFVSVSDDGALMVGYNYNDNQSVYTLGTSLGVGDYEGETVYLLGRFNDDINAIGDWTIEPGASPLATSEEGGISAEVTMQCEATFVSEDVGEQFFDQACAFAGDDDRFVPAPQVLGVRVFTVDGSAFGSQLQQSSFVIVATTDGFVFSGIADEPDTMRAVGVRPGTGEFEAMEIHDVYYIEIDDAANLTGTMRSTVSPDET